MISCRYRPGSLMDHMLTMMEKHADNLEVVIEERTRQLVDEKKRIDVLLYRMMPPYVALYAFVNKQS